MKLIVLGLQRTSTFIYILAALLLFYLVFNLNYQWFGISLIVRIYIYLFCFYLVFNFSSINIDLYEEVYKTRFGRHGEQILFYKARIVPFLIIFGIIVVFGLIDNLGRPDWPWRPLLGILDGRYSNLMFFSLFLLFVLKIRKEPLVTVPVFLALCVAYFYLDSALQSVLVSGAAVHLAMYLKWLVFFFLLFVEFYVRRSRIKLLITAFVVSVATYGLYIGGNMLVFKWSRVSSYQKRESGLQLLRLGFVYPLPALKKVMLLDPKPDLLRFILDHAKESRYEMSLAPVEWERLLFSGSVEMADMAAEYMVERNITVPYEKITTYAAEKSLDPDSNIESAHGFIRLAALSLPGNEKDFQNRVRGSGKRFTLWAIAVMAEQKNPEFMPLLIEYLTDIDPSLAESAYTALSRISGTDPKEKLNKKINDSAVVVFFKEYFLQNRTAH